MSISRSLEIAASGLTAQRVRMDTIAGNIANINTTRTADGQPYRRRVAVLQAQGGGFAGAFGRAREGAAGVRVARIAEDRSPLRRVYEPGHPDADAQGYLTMPNVNPVTEMVDLMMATRAYEAGVSAIGATRQMQQKALEIGRA
ncbi:MAG: flagellar basal body rod protein FlgC [Chthonomonadales bacterium]|nr:flagellar basal body rod protein FlgC [Chthonomonadales bacterium]